MSMALVSLTGGLKAQDVHFSQWYAAPMTVNPALTGVFDGTVRVCNSYRSQWSSLGQGYKTLHLSVDAPIAKGALENKFFGAGFMVYQDKAGTAEFKRTMVQGSLSYTAAMDVDLAHWISFGFQAGLDQLAFDFSQARWDEQWNGDRWDPSIPTTEILQLPTFAYVDLHAGVNYYYAPDGFNTVSAGVSLSHIGTPNTSFFLEEEDALIRRVTAHASGDLSLDKDHTMWIDPRILVNIQGKQKEAVAGAYFRNKLQFKSLYTNYRREVYFYLGAFYRLQESFIASARFEYNTVGLGVSYDFGAGKLSQLATANSWEITLSFVSPVQRGQKAKNYNKMPRFL